MKGTPAEMGLCSSRLQLPKQRLAAECRSSHRHGSMLTGNCMDKSKETEDLWQACEVKDCFLEERVCEGEGMVCVCRVQRRQFSLILCMQC